MATIYFPFLVLNVITTLVLTTVNTCISYTTHLQQVLKYLTVPTSVLDNIENMYTHMHKLHMTISSICIDILPLSWMCLFCDNILVHRYLLISWKHLFMKPLMDVQDYPYMYDKSIINALCVSLQRLLWNAYTQTYWLTTRKTTRCSTGPRLLTPTSCLTYIKLSHWYVGLTSLYVSRSTNVLRRAL